MHRKRDIDQLLARVPLFGACSPRELEEVSRHTTRVRIPAGKVVERQGEPGQEFVVIIDGTATVSIDGAAVAALGPGDFFGEIALLDGGPRTASVAAGSDLLVEVLNPREFDTLLVNVPGFTRSILKGVAARLRATDAQLPHWTA